MTVTGKYYTDDNSTYIFKENTVYIVSKGESRSWTTMKVGYRTRFGIFTKDMYEDGLSKCKRAGTFKLD